MSLHIVYALTDVDGSVRYIGRSSCGLWRAKEHATRVGRERTRKASWIRSLLRRGAMYGIRVLEECSSRAQVIEREVWWIAEGRRLGWRLTNLTDGGEGTARKKVNLPDAEIVRAYLDGASELSLARKYDVNRFTITRRLREASVERRGISAAGVLRMQRMTPEARRRNARPAQLARRARCAERRLG